MKTDCKRFAKSLHAYVDGAVSPALHAAMQTHAASCQACHREVESLTQLETVLRAAPQPPSVPEGFAARVMARAAEQKAQAPLRLVALFPHFSWWEDLARPARVAAAAVLFAGLALGAVMGWDANRTGRSPSSVAAPPDALAAYNLDYLAEAPAGSLAQVWPSTNEHWKGAIAMSRSTRTLLIILSVALNLAFVTVWALHRLPLGCGHHAARVPSRGMESDCSFHERIDATPAQRQEIESRLEAFRKTSMPLCMEVNKHRIDLIDLLAAPAPDRAAIAAKQKQIADGQSKMQERVIANLLEMKAALTPQQQRTLFDTIRERSDCAGHGPMANRLLIDFPGANA